MSHELGLDMSHLQVGHFNEAVKQCQGSFIINYKLLKKSTTEAGHAHAGGGVDARMARILLCRLFLHHDSQEDIACLPNSTSPKVYSTRRSITIIIRVGSVIFKTTGNVGSNFLSSHRSIKLKEIWGKTTYCGQHRMNKPLQYKFSPASSTQG